MDEWMVRLIRDDDIDDDGDDRFSTIYIKL